MEISHSRADGEIVATVPVDGEFARRLFGGWEMGLGRAVALAEIERGPATGLWFWIAGKIAADTFPGHDPPVAWRAGPDYAFGGTIGAVCVPSMPEGSVAIGHYDLPVLLDGEPGC